MMIQHLLNRLKRLDWGLIAALALALPIIMPMLHDGIVITAHGHIHLHRALSASVSLDNGLLFPRWSPYTYLGYGYPALNYYAPGFYILTALIEKLTPLDIIGAYKLITIGIVFVYSGGAFLLARRLSDTSGGLFAAAIYTYSPFLLRDLYMVGTVAQYVAFGFVPLVLWAFVRVIDTPNIGSMVLAGMLLALLTVTHQIAIYLFAPFLVIFVLVLSFNRKGAKIAEESGYLLPFVPPHCMGRSWGWGPLLTRHSSLVASFVAILFALALSAVYWLPLLLELSYVQTGLPVDPAYRIENNFVTLSRLFTGTTLIDQTLLNIWTEAGPLGLRIGHAQLGVIGLALLVWVRPVGWRLRWLATCCAGLALICIFMMTPASLPLWNVLPGASLMQFPWRLLALVNVLAVPCAVAVVMLFPEKWRKWTALGGVVIAFALILPLTYAQLGFDRFEGTQELTPADTLAYEVKSGQTGLGSYSEFITTWAVTPPTTPPTEDLQAAYQTRMWYIGIHEDALSDGVTVSEIKPDYGVMRYRFEAQTPATITLDQFYFPGFEIRVNSETVVSRPTDQTGLMQFDLPVGTSEVTIRYVGTTVQTIASLISLITLGSVGVLMGIGMVRQARTNRQDTESAEDYKKNESQRRKERKGNVNLPFPFAPPHRMGWGWGSLATHHSSLSLMLIALICVFLALDQTVIRPHTLLFRLQNDPQNPPMSQPVHIVFGDQLELLGYDLPQDSATQGDTIPLRLYWRVLRPTDANLRAVVRLTSSGGVEEWSKVIALHIANLPTTQWLTERYVIDDYLLTINAQASPFLGQLTVSVFPEYTDLAYLSTQTGQTEVTLAPFRVTGNLRQVAEADLTRIDAEFANGLRLIGVATESDDDAQTCMILRWHVERDQTVIYSTLLHFVDANGIFLQAADAEPFGGLYSTSHWQAGQTLDVRYCFAIPDNAASLLIGLYDARTVERVPIAKSGVFPIRDHTVEIGIDEAGNFK